MSCVNCNLNEFKIIECVRENGIQEHMKIYRMKNKIADWFKKIGIYSPLPRIFSCGKLDINKNTFSEKQDTKKSVHITLSLPDLELNYMPKWIYYWYTNQRNLDNTEFPCAMDAYGDFSNDGLVSCQGKENVTFYVDNPVPYRENGINYEPHIHFAVLQPDNTWSIRPWSLQVFPHLTNQQFKTIYDENPRKYIILNAMEKTYQGKKTPIIKNTKRIPYSIQNSLVEKRLIRYIKKYRRNKNLIQYIHDGSLLKHIPIVVFCAHSKCKASHMLAEKLKELHFVNILYYPDGVEGFSS